MNWTVDDYPTISFETFEEKDLLGLINALKPLIDAGAIDAQYSWFRHLVADIVSRYSDVDVSELLDEDQHMEQLPPEQQIPGAQVQPTPEEQQAQTSQEQADLITEVSKQITPKDQVNAAKPKYKMYTPGSVVYTSKPNLKGPNPQPANVRDINNKVWYQDIVINKVNWSVKLPSKTGVSVWKMNGKNKWKIHYSQPSGYSKG